MRGDLFGASLASLGPLVENTDAEPSPLVDNAGDVEALAIGAPGRSGGQGAVFVVRYNITSGKEKE